MIYEKKGKVIKGLGGLYEVLLDDGERVSCRAKGSLKREEEKVLIGDNVSVSFDDATPDGVVISTVLERKNALIRPAMANLDYLFITLAARKPTPVLETVDKLTAISEHNRILPIIIITKRDLGENEAEEYRRIYTSVGYPTFVTSSDVGCGINELRSYLENNLKNGATAAFAGASGVGKSTLMNALFPELSLATSDISRKIERGRHTTRHVELYEVFEGGFLADTPGFSLIDFERFNFFELEHLAPAFREFGEYLGSCRYADCAHVGEGDAECAVVRAVKEGRIPASRLESYRSIYRVLKAKKSYD
nr:ribosome small subunit-dependent GTPase A [Clostridia bacterium]